MISYEYQCVQIKLYLKQVAELYSDVHGDRKHIAANKIHKSSKKINVSRSRSQYQYKNKNTKKDNTVQHKKSDWLIVCSFDCDLYLVPIQNKECEEISKRRILARIVNTVRIQVSGDGFHSIVIETKIIKQRIICMIP